MAAGQPPGSGVAPMMTNSPSTCGCAACCGCRVAATLISRAVYAPATSGISTDPDLGDDGVHDGLAAAELQRQCLADASSSWPHAFSQKNYFLREYSWSILPV